MKSIAYQLILAAFLSTAFLGCTKKTEWLASVGNQRISREDVELRKEMIRLSNPKVTTPEALKQLIDYKVGVEILQSMGNRINQKDISTELEKIRNESKKDNKTEALLKAYQHNPSFSELYLYPRIVSHKINWLYENDKAFHEKELGLASTLLTKAKAEPAKFEAFAAEMELPFLQGSFSEKDKQILWEIPRGLASTSVRLPKEAWFSQRIKNQFLSKTAPNQMFSEPQPFWFGYLILRRDPSEKNSYAFSVSVAPRKDKGKWIHQKSYWLPISKFD